LAIWKLEDAKNQFSRLVQAARRQGPQVVTRHGREEVVVMAIEEYRKLARRQEGLVAFLRGSPLAEAIANGELELLRSRDLARDISL
jgi:prevent-host-death family protein